MSSRPPRSAGSSSRCFEKSALPSAVAEREPEHVAVETLVLFVAPCVEHQVAEPLLARYVFDPRVTRREGGVGELGIDEYLERIAGRVAQRGDASDPA